LRSIKKLEEEDSKEKIQKACRHGNRGACFYEEGEGNFLKEGSQWKKNQKLLLENCLRPWRKKERGKTTWGKEKKPPKGAVFEKKSVGWRNCCKHQ